MFDGGVVTLNNATCDRFRLTAGFEGVVEDFAAEGVERGGAVDTEVMFAVAAAAFRAAMALSIMSLKKRHDC